MKWLHFKRSSQMWVGITIVTIAADSNKMQMLSFIRVLDIKLPWLLNVNPGPSSFQSAFVLRLILMPAYTFIDFSLRSFLKKKKKAMKRKWLFVWISLKSHLVKQASSALVKTQNSFKWSLTVLRNWNLKPCSKLSQTDHGMWNACDIGRIAFMPIQWRKQLLVLLML